MKKCIIIGLGCLLLTGCAKTEEMECKYHNNGDNNTFDDVVTVKIKDGIVDDATMVRSFKDKAGAKNFYKFTSNASDAKGNVELDGKKVIANNYHDMVAKSIDKKEVTKKEFKEVMEDQGYVCK